MNVLLINNLAFGGAERLVIEIARALPKTSIITLWRDSNEYECSDVRRYVLFSKECFLALKILISAKVIHFHLFPTMWTVLFFVLSRKILIYTEHNTHNRRRTKRWLRPLESYFYSKFDHVVAISVGVKKSLLNWQPNLKVRVIENGVKKFSSNNVKKVDNQILMIGRFSPQKDQISIIKAIKLLPLNYSIVLVGAGASTFSMALPETMNDRVKFYEASDDIAAHYARSDIYVQSSHWEGFGLTVIEAMSSGLPVVGTDVAGLRDLLHPECVFPVANSQKLAEIIMRLSDTSFRNKVVSHSGKTYQKYKLEKMIDRYSELYG
jgi:glycosyltransferase involved in cell wall biosynthesis